MADYKPAQLAGMKGFEDYIPIIKPNVSAIKAIAPGYSTVMEWPDPFPAKDILAKLPGGKLSSMPSMQQMTYVAFQYTPQGMGVYARQPLVDPAKKIGWDPNKKSVRSFSTDLSIIDPLGSIENVTGEFFGLQTAVIGSGGSVADPLNWIGERNISFENYPTRLMDYAFSTLPMIAMHLMGMQTKSSIPRNVDGEGFFPFENDPNYWAGMSNWKGTRRPPTDDELMNEAKAQASAVSMTPSLLIPSLYERYKWGRDLMVHAYTSGNERVDYIAKKEVEELIKILRAGATGTIPLFVNAKGEQVGPIAFANSLPGLVQQLLGGVNQVARSAVTLIPGVGTPLADILMPVNDETERVWTSLTADQRRSLMADAQMTTMMTDVVVTLPLLSGAGSLLSALKAGAGGGDFMAWAAKAGMVKDASMVTKGMSAADEIAAITKGWTVGRATFNVAKQVTYDLAGMAPRATQGAIAGFGRMALVMDRLMAAGMASMLVNWGLESFVPGYAEAVGYDIDQSRPWSESAVAGLLNNMGYFSSATAGFNTMQRMTRSIPKYTGKAVGKTGVLGNPEQRFFSSHMGGGQRVAESQQVWSRPDGAPPTDPDFNIPVMATADSGLEHMVQNAELERVTREVINDPDLAALPIEERVALANEDLLNSLTNTADRKATLGGLLNHLGSETSFIDDLLLTDAQRVAQNAQAKVAREVDDRIASWLSRLYSETWWQRQFRSLGVSMTPGRAVADFKGWMRSAAQRTGWSFNEAKAVELWGDDVTAWRQAANLFHAKEFMMTNAELIEAAKVSPVEGLLAHPEDYFLMRADHLFTDRADFLRAAIKQMGTDTPLLPGGEEEVRALAAREIRTTQELDEWWARVYKTKGRDEGGIVNPEEVDLDALVEYIEESYATLPGRHPIKTFDPMTADYPINRLAERLGREKMYAVAYKPKDAIIAYRPVERTLAVRVSRNAPDGFTFDPPAAAAGYESDGLFHATTARSIVLAEGLRAQREVQAGRAPGVGLGQGFTGPGWHVSLATSEAQAMTIAERLALAAKASRGEVSVEEILNAFPMWDDADLIRILGVPKASQRTADRVELWIQRGFATPEQRYDLVKRLDDAIANTFEADSGEFAVGLTATFEQMARVDPADVGYVRVARREGVEPTRVGPDIGELQYRSSDLWVVDERAAARHAGWTDDAQQPLDNQWEQPWSGVVEDPTAGAEPVYSHVSYVRLKDGTIVRAPFRDYPMNPSNIYLGNRSLLGRKYDSIFQGVRSWRMSEHHLAQMARSFGGRYGFTPAQVELFKDRVEAYARSTAFSGIGGAGQIKITPFANARLRSEEVNKIGQKIFGTGKVKNLVTGEMEDLDYARMFADAHQQAWTLNFTSGIISRVKNFDLLSIGTGSTWVADWLIPVLRFKASPVFRVSELLESKVFNSMRGVNVSEEERKVYIDAGLHPNPNLLSSDFGTEPLLESMFSPGQNQAASQTMAGIHGLDDLVAGEGTTGVAASFVIWRDVDDLLSRKGLSGLKDDIKDPARYKNGLMFDQQIESVRRELPIIIKARDPRAYKILSEDLKVPDDQMARFIAEDRVLYGKWQHGKISFEELLAHSNKYIKKEVDEVEEAALKAMYETEDWKVIDTLMRVASMSAQAEAFGTHFFGTYRSALERSINHPLLGIYPASWMYKAAKEWGKFLYDNRTFGHGSLRLGMYPAVAMNELVKNVNMTVAMNTGQGWQDWLDNGPARNWLFLWNLLLPGDWSSLPLPLARPLRTIYRNLQAGNWEGLAPWNVAADTLMGPQGRGGIGIIRDINLAARGLYDIAEYAAGGKPGELENLANGLSLDGHAKAPYRYSELLNWPDAMSPVNPPP